MARADKEASVAEMTEAFRSSNAVLVTEYRGLTVAQITELRTALGSTTHYSVAKNTLARIAVERAGIDGIGDLLSGPTAVAFVAGDPVEAAKGLRDFAKGNPALVVKGGYLDGRALGAAEVGKLADLESREVLLAKIAGGLNAGPARAVGLFSAPLSQVARLAAALRDQRTEQEAA